MREEIAGAEPPEHLTAHWDPGLWASEFMAGPARDPVELLTADQGRLLGSARVVGTPYLAVRPRRNALRGRTPPAVSPR
ncbi:hypothetical protein GCM10010300_72640 [Streptomyces olivaceoviridis]|nr:hypothetical protein GCM10010300_72640 [Streptomyces olivaceoviridis]